MRDERGREGGKIREKKHRGWKETSEGMKEKREEKIMEEGKGK